MDCKEYEQELLNVAQDWTNKENQELLMRWEVKAYVEEIEEIGDIGNVGKKKKRWVWIWRFKYSLLWGNN